MKWFKHMSDMSADVKIKRLVRAYGVEGYGLYNYILELIVRKLETESPLPDLEESSQDIAGDLRMDTIRVEEIMLFCIQQGLFEQDEVTGRIVAAKVYKFLAQSETRSKELRAMISSYRDRSSDVNGSCYILRGESLHKIGKAGNVEIRRRELSSQVGEELAIVAVKKTTGALSLEKALHAEFAEKRVTGEWFDLSEDDVKGVIERYNFEGVTPVSDRSEEQNRTEQNRREKEDTCVSAFETSSQKKPGPPAADDPAAFGAYWENRSRLAGPIEYPLDFERFWESYPRPVDKKGTLRKWARTLKKGAATVEELHRAAMGYRKQKVDHEGTNRQYLKHSTTFLGDTEPWRDYLTPDVPVQEAGRVCPKCGAAIFSTESFCLECGADFD